MDNKPEQSQLIISLTDNEISNLPDNVKIIKLESKQDVLVENEYEDVKEEIDRLIYSPDAILSHYE